MAHVEIHLYHHVDPAFIAKVDELIRAVNRTGAAVMATMDDLEAEVAQNTDATASAVALMNGLSAQLKDAIAANDPAAVQAVVDQLDANTAALSEAVAANTPAAPEAPAEQPPVEEAPPA